MTMENVTRENGATNQNFTIYLNLGNSLEQSKDFQSSRVAGAKSSKLSKLTYEDIFYREVSPQRERERERMAAQQKPERKHTDAWISDATGRMVQQRPQTRSNHESTNLRIYESTDFPDCQRLEDHNGVQENSRRERRIYGFATRNCPWCQSCLKGAKLDNPFPMSARARRRR